MAEFLKKIMNVVDDHPSTLGYEILNDIKYTVINNGKNWANSIHSW